MSRLDRLYSPPEIGAPGQRAARDRRRDLLLAGAFALVMLGVAAALLLLLAPGLIGGYTLRAYFGSADGLERGIDVMQEGFVIGRVRTVDPVFSGDRDRGDCPEPAPNQAPDLPCFRATLAIQAGWPVPADSDAQLAPAGVLKGNLIRIHPGTALANLDPGSYIPTRERQPDLWMQIASTLDQAQRAIDTTVRPALERIQGLLASMQTEGGAGAGEGSPFAEVLTNLTQITADVQSITGDIAQFTGGLEQAAAQDQISGILADTRAFTGTLGTRSAEISTTLQSYEDLASDLQQVVDSAGPDVTASLQDVQRLLQEVSAALTPVLANIETASRNLAALTGDVRQDPKALLFRGGNKEPAPWFSR
jgi:phospholipid/cholesterol/gamma-HCH transport system substrate-binding protein